MLQCYSLLRCTIKSASSRLNGISDVLSEHCAHTNRANMLLRPTTENILILSFLPLRCRPFALIALTLILFLSFYSNRSRHNFHECPISLRLAVSLSFPSVAHFAIFSSVYLYHARPRWRPYYFTRAERRHHYTRCISSRLLARTYRRFRRINVYVVTIASAYECFIFFLY